MRGSVSKEVDDIPKSDVCVWMCVCVRMCVGVGVCRCGCVDVGGETVTVINPSVITYMCVSRE